MKLHTTGLTALTLLVLGAVPLTAQQQEQPTAWVSGTYYRCDQSRADRASEIVRSVVAPIVQKHVDAGQISAWGFLAHHTGGDWRRAMYYVGPDLEALQAADDSIAAELASSHAKETTEFLSICPSHDDYIWAYVTGSQPATEVGGKRPSVGLSTYQVCHEATEGLSDEVMKSVFAPIYDKQVKAGRLHSWGWFSHFIGGKYRRLLTMDGPSFDAVLAARDSIIADTQAQFPQTSAAVTRVCDGHTDYLWEIEIAKP